MEGFTMMNLIAAVRRGIPALLNGLLLFAVGAFAQTTGTTQRKAATKIATPTQRQPSLGGFTAQDIEGVIQRLILSALKPKSEFETKEQYQKRLALANDSGQLLFILPDDLIPSIFTYNAEDQMMKVDLDPHISEHKVYKVEPPFDNFNPASESPQLHKVYELDLKKRTIKSGKYIGSNAFGVKTVISYREYVSFGLTLDERGLLPTNYSWQIASTEAQQAKTFLRVALLCVQSVPSIYRDVYYHDPTISDRFEIGGEKYYLPVSIQQMWVFDSRSGKIIKKFDGAPTPPLTPPLTPPPTPPPTPPITAVLSGTASEPVFEVRDVNGCVLLTVSTLVQYSEGEPVFRGLVKNVSGKSLVVDTLMATVHRKDGSAVQFTLGLCDVRWCEFPKDAVGTFIHPFAKGSLTPTTLDSVSITVNSISKN